MLSACKRKMNVSNIGVIDTTITTVDNRVLNDSIYSNSLYKKDTNVFIHHENIDSEEIPINPHVSDYDFEENLKGMIRFLYKEGLSVDSIVKVLGAESYKDKIPNWCKGIVPKQIAQPIQGQTDQPIPEQTDQPNNN